MPFSFDELFLKVLFVPFALRKQDEYAAKAREPFEKWGFEFSSLHTEEDKISALKSAQALFIGGGNTFQLLNLLTSSEALIFAFDAFLNILQG